MYTIKPLPEFSAWLSGLFKDGMTHRRLATRLRKATLGNLGDVKPVGEGVFEMREHFGSGWRMSYVQRGAVLIVMLAVAINPRSPLILPKPSSWPQPLRSEP